MRGRMGPARAAARPALPPQRNQRGGGDALPGRAVVRGARHPQRRHLPAAGRRCARRGHALRQPRRHAAGHRAGRRTRGNLRRGPSAPAAGRPLPDVGGQQRHRAAAPPHPARAAGLELRRAAAHRARGAHAAGRIHRRIHAGLGARGAGGRRDQPWRCGNRRRWSPNRWSAWMPAKAWFATACWPPRAPMRWNGWPGAARYATCRPVTRCTGAMRCAPPGPTSRR
ncbi:hypothetical protein D3C86_1181090 [compost metagenome]